MTPHDGQIGWSSSGSASKPVMHGDYRATPLPIAVGVAWPEMQEGPQAA